MSKQVGDFFQIFVAFSENLNFKIYLFSAPIDLLKKSLLGKSIWVLEKQN